MASLGDGSQPSSPSHQLANLLYITIVPNVPLERRFTFALSKALHATRKRRDPAVPGYRMRFLMKVGMGEHETLASLAAELGMPVSTASTHAKVLERQGLLVRSRPPANERSLKLELTSAGRQCIVLRNRLDQGAMNAIIDALGTARVEELADTLERLADAGFDGLWPDLRTGRLEEWEHWRLSSLSRGDSVGPPPHSRFAAALARAVFAIGARRNPALPEHQVRVLLMVGLGRHGTLTTLARELGIPLSTASRHVKDLERRGLLSRSRHPTNERILRIELTQEGRDRIVLRKHFDSGALDSIFTRLGERRVDGLIATLEGIADAGFAGLEASLRAERLDEWETWRLHNVEELAPKVDSPCSGSHAAHDGWRLSSDRADVEQHAPNLQP